MPIPMNKVTIIVEPLDGSPGQKIEIYRAGRVEVGHHWEEDDDRFRPLGPVVTPTENRLTRVDLEIPVFADPETGATYRMEAL